MMFERMDPKTLSKWLVLAAIVYLVLPYDLFPDFLGLPGRIDDLLLMGWLWWFYRSHVQQSVARGPRQEQAGRSAGAREEARAGANDSKAFDPYEILGVTRSASMDAIRAAYRARMKEYHPDKVAHLGEELQSLAMEKTQQIQRAYRQLHG